MAPPKSIHVCSVCGHESPRWAGQCPSCDEWNTLVEELRRPANGSSLGARPHGGAGAVAPIELGQVSAAEHERLSTGIGELDGVLGGGLVPGSLVLLGGAPGIGKSTLTTMALANLVAAGCRTLYVSAEESAAQIRLRAQRLTGGDPMRIPVIAETDLHTVLATLERERPEVCVIDSVQTLQSGELARRRRIGWAGARGRRRDPTCGEGAADRGRARRTRDQGWRARRAEGAGASGRLRAPVRGRA